MTMGDVQHNMRGYLPDFLANSSLMGSLLDREGAEAAALSAATDDVLAQFYVDTATWGLGSWERFLGLATDSSKPYEQRRSVVKSKLRGIGTVTVDLIKNVAEAFANGEVQVTEILSDYTVKITFIGKRGVPENLLDIENALREIIPAHLGLKFEFTYLRWEEFDAYDYVWDTLDGLQLTWNQFEIYRK